MIAMFSNKEFKTLPDLPDGIKFLWCENNLLTNLPVLPALKILNVSHNLLTELPSLPETLLNLHCDNNQIKVLPPLPESLVFLSCLGNPIDVVPELPPNLRTLYVSHPTHLPTLHKNLTNPLFYSLKRLDDDSFIRLIDHLPNMSYDRVLAELMWRDVSRIAVLRRMLTSPWFDRKLVVECLVKLAEINTNLGQKVNADVVSLILSY